MKLAIIPARGGSKRIPRKNIRLFGGKPMIGWSIDAALRSGCFDRVIVSTDDAEIADLGKQYGAEVPFIRPAELSDDHATTTDVLCHAIEWITKNDFAPSTVCCVYATAPFLEPGSIRAGLDLLESSGADFAFSATSYPFPVQRAIRLRPDARVEMLTPEHFSSRSQDLEEYFHDAGQFYWGLTSAWMSRIPIFSSSATAVVLPRYRVQDIDTIEDWIRAELMFKALHVHDSIPPV
jgi:pseudaminic acid cytidylyltransferase